VAALLGWYVGRVVSAWGDDSRSSASAPAVVRVRLLRLEGFVQPCAQLALAAFEERFDLLRRTGGPSCCCSPLSPRSLGPSTLLTASENVGILAAQASGRGSAVSPSATRPAHGSAAGGTSPTNGLRHHPQFSLPTAISPR